MNGEPKMLHNSSKQMYETESSVASYNDVDKLYNQALKFTEQY